MTIHTLELGPGASKHLSRAVFNMTTLQSLDLHGVKFDQEFYSAMTTTGKTSQVIIHSIFLDVSL